MNSSNPVTNTRLTGNSAMALGATVGGVFGAISVLAAGNGLLIAALAIVIGFLAAGWNPPFRLLIVTTTTALFVAMVCGMIANSAWAGALLGLVNGAFYTLLLVAPVLIIAAIRGRRSYVQRGWDLAMAEAREQDARISEAVTRERDAMASEIHDGVGHRITLIAVQAGRLSLDESLPAAARDELESIRANAAAASDEVGQTVQLLGERRAGLTASLSGLDVMDVMERARASGLEVNSTIADDSEAGTSDYARSALLRALQESLTNAAKHAPGAPVDVEIDSRENWLRLRVSNPMPAAGASTGAMPRTMTPAATAPAPVAPPLAHGASGNGLIALRHRASILGGELHVDRSTRFTVTVRLPRDAAPLQPADTPAGDREHAIATEGTHSGSSRRRAAQAAWLLPAALLAAALLATAGYFAYATLASVLPPERFTAIDVGDSRDQVENSLPPMEMLEPPRAENPARDDATCEYYEASISFFDRDHVFRICFADNRVMSTDTIHPDE